MVSFGMIGMVVGAVVLLGVLFVVIYYASK